MPAMMPTAASPDFRARGGSSTVFSSSSTVFSSVLFLRNGFFIEISLHTALCSPSRPSVLGPFGRRGTFLCRNAGTQGVLALTEREETLPRCRAAVRSALGVGPVAVATANPADGAPVDGHHHDADEDHDEGQGRNQPVLEAYSPVDGRQFAVHVSEPPDWHRQVAGRVSEYPGRCAAKPVPAPACGGGQGMADAALGTPVRDEGQACPAACARSPGGPRLGSAALRLTGIGLPELGPSSVGYSGAVGWPRPR